MGATSRFVLWKTIKLGVGLATVDDFCNAFSTSGLRCSQGAIYMLSKSEFAVAGKFTEVDLVVVSGRDLGFEANMRYAQICARAKELGLELCPAEVGPQLRLQHLDQPNGEQVVIAMEAICDSYGYLNVFCLEHDDSGRWLVAYYGNPGSIWYPDSEFVFVLPRK